MEAVGATQSPNGRLPVLPQLTTVTLLLLTVLSVSVLRPYVPTGCFDVCIDFGPLFDTVALAVYLSPLFGLLILETASALLVNRRQRLGLGLCIVGAACGLAVPTYASPDMSHPYSVALATATAGIAVITPALLLLSARGRLQHGEVPAVITTAVVLLAEIGQTARSGATIPPGGFDRVTALIVTSAALLTLGFLTGRALQRRASPPDAAAIVAWVLLLLSLFGEGAFLLGIANESHMDPVRAWLTRPWIFTV